MLRRFLKRLNPSLNDFGSDVAQLKSLAAPSTLELLRRALPRVELTKCEVSIDVQTGFVCLRVWSGERRATFVEDPAGFPSPRLLALLVLFGG
jgi:hypothetical protein